MIDIILNGRLASAEAAGVEVEILNAQAPETLPLSETDLCSLMLNLVDNAVAAASAPGIERARIRLELRVKAVSSCSPAKTPARRARRKRRTGRGWG